MQENNAKQIAHKINILKIYEAFAHLLIKKMNVKTFYAINQHFEILRNMYY